MKVCILFHDNCFDGMSSAGLFFDFVRSKIDPRAEPIFGGLSHGPVGESADLPIQTGPLIPGRLTGEMNAIVDFRYLSDPRLDWWFDHHVSAFQAEGDREHFEADQSGRKYFDPEAPSCAGMMVRMLARDHGFDPEPHAELVHWAQIIDSASFTDPKMAVELAEPALRLMTWIENSTDFSRRTEIILRMTRDPLALVAGLPFVVEELEPVLERHQSHIEAMRDGGEVDEEVFFCDLTDRRVDAVNKFIPYYLNPRARYAVVITKSSSRAKVSVGYSPWGAPEAREHDISKLCERYGGGGHAVVGAVSLSSDKAEDAVEIGRAIASELRSSE